MTDMLEQHVRDLPDPHLRAAIDGQLDALSALLRGKRAWGTQDEITDGLRVLAVELRQRHALAAR
jgi:hypothetical protein